MKRYYLRLFLWILLVVVGAVFLFGFWFSVARDKYLMPDVSLQMRSLQNQISRTLEGKTAEEARETLAENTDRLLFEAEVVTELAPDQEGTFLLRPAGADYAVVLRPDQQKMRKLEEEQKGALAISLLSVLGLIGVVGWLIGAPLVRKLRLQERAMRRMAEGDLHSRVEVRGKDAVASLGQRFNEMGDRIESLVSHQRELLHAVSHEMRTPCTRLRFGLDLLEQAKDEEERADRVAALHGDIVEMDDLLQELLDYLRFADSKEAMPMEEVDLQELGAPLAEKASAERAEVEVTTEILPRSLLRAHPRHLARVIENLLRNGVRHARSRVHFSVVRDGGWWRIGVEDDGPGIPAADRGKVFEPFERLERSRSRESGGAGLGLAIARRIVERHGGTIDSVDPRNLGGARFEVRLPAGGT